VVAVIVAAGALGAVLATRPAARRPVPDVTHVAVGAARRRLAAAHLHLLVAASVYDAAVEAGDTIGQSPAAATELRPGGTVSVTVSKGPSPVAIPAGLVGGSLAGDEAVLEALGLRVGPVSEAPSETVPSGDVVSTAPSTGSLLPGRSIAMVVSTGKPIVVVPTLAGTAASGFAAAQQALAAVGLGATEQQEYSSSVPRGEVVVTAPGPGARVRQGTVVVVEVSKGPDTVVVGDVRGDSVAAATADLGAQGLDVSGVSGNPTAAVTGTQPAAGTTVVLGTNVVLVTG
jgi:serine/threonine-protein kinase